MILAVILNTFQYLTFKRTASLALREEKAYWCEEPGWRFLSINNIISWREDSWTSIILFRTASFASSRFAGVKESEIRLPSGLSNVNSLPTYFQLTSNQQALFRGTNNRNKTFQHVAWKSRLARLGTEEDRPAIDLNQKNYTRRAFIFPNKRNNLLWSCKKLKRVSSVSQHRCRGCLYS